ncbi:hypothetical protein NFI96_010245 [Prochilodus magdalenae]|nr:hypothetical protein NFI96_010245 [Prochilodus magdalenae]
MDLKGAALYRVVVGAMMQFLSQNRISSLKAGIFTDLSSLEWLDPLCCERSITVIDTAVRYPLQGSTLLLEIHYSDPLCYKRSITVIATARSTLLIQGSTLLLEIHYSDPLCYKRSITVIATAVRDPLQGSTLLLEIHYSDPLCYKRYITVIATAVAPGADGESDSEMMDKESHVTLVLLELIGLCLSGVKS